MQSSLKHRAIRVSTWINGVCLALALLYAVSTWFVVLNVQPSVPVGLWRLQAVRGPITRGTVVLYPPPQAAWPFHPWWVPFLKPVGAVAGEPVCVVDRALWIGDAWYGPVHPEVGGTALPHLAGCITIQPGDVFTASHAPRSHDGRYYGPIPVSSIKAIATPLWVWR